VILLRTPRLVLRRWREEDRELFHRINSDAQVMEFFPRRRTREQSDELMDGFNADIDANGFGLTAVELAETGKPAGFCGLTPVKMEPIFAAGTVEVGWRLAPEFWGKGIASEAAAAWLDFGFDRLELPEIVAFAVPGNARSIAVMRRLGMRPATARNFDHPRIPDDTPHLKPHVVYEIAREEWISARGK